MPYKDRQKVRTKMLLDIPEELLAGLCCQSKNGVIYDVNPNDYIPKEPRFGYIGGSRMMDVINHLNNRIDDEMIHHVVDMQFVSDQPDHFVCLYTYY